MFTVLTSFKPFEGEARIHQMNALRSWMQSFGSPEIIVFGDEPGLREVADTFGLTVISDVPRGPDGKVRVDQVFAYAQKAGRFDRQVYVNGDILLLKDFASAFSSIRLSRFLMVGQRIDVDVTEALDFSDEEKLPVLIADLTQRGTLHAAYGLDYFAYTRGSLHDLPPLYLAASRWDNLMVLLCRQHKTPVIDATADVRAFHQNHAYRGTAEGPSVDSNQELWQKSDAGWLFDTSDSSHWLEGGVLRNAASSRARLARNIATIPVCRNWPRPLRRPFRAAAKLVNYAGRFVGLPAHP